MLTMRGGGLSLYSHVSAAPRARGWQRRMCRMRRDHDVVEPHPRSFVYPQKNAGGFQVKAVDTTTESLADSNRCNRIAAPLTFHQSCRSQAALEGPTVAGIHGPCHNSVHAFRLLITQQAQ